MKSIDGWLDLCSGIGPGFPYAGIKLWERSPNLFCERDEYCRRIINLRFPGRPIATDVKRSDWRFTYATDLVSASPPCQPLSTEGKRLGADDDRDCIPAVLNAIRELQPKFAVIENVPGLLNCPDRPGSDQLYFAGILKHLSESGYDAEWQCIGSSAFFAPWVRARVLITAIARSVKLDWSRTASWEEQIRLSVNELGITNQFGGNGPGIPRIFLQSAAGFSNP